MAKKTNPPMIWTELHDELLCREVVLVQPFAYRPSTRERGNAWSRIAQALNEIQEPKFYVSQRSVRERFNLILTRFKEKTTSELKASGVSVDPLTPSELLLEDLILKIQQFEAEFQSKTQEKNEKAEYEKEAVDDARKKAMETLKETKKRKESEGNDSKRKRSRSTGNDTLTYLREKAAQDKELKQKELDAQIQHQQMQQQMQQQMLQLLASQQQQMLTLLQKKI